MTIDFTVASVNMADGLSAAAERPISINAQTRAASFGVDLQAAQLIAASGEIGTSAPDVPLDDPGTSDSSEDPSTAEQIMCLGIIILPLPIELCPSDTSADPQDDSVQLLPNDSKPLSHTELPQPIAVGLALIGEPGEELPADPQSVSIDPVTVDLPTLDPGLPFTPDPISPSLNSPLSTIDERLLADSSLDDVRLSIGEQTPTQQTVDEELPSFDAPAPDAVNTVPVDRLAGFYSVLPNPVHTNIPHAATQPSHSPGGMPVEPRTELSEVVRQVRTMVTAHETRSTIQLEPAELGRLTLEVVDAPEGLRAHVSAEDPSVLRFLERNVQLLETEARLQGVGQMSFSVGADVSGGLGRGDQRQSEAEASLRKNIEWNTTPQAKPRSRRELDTNA